MGQQVSVETFTSSTDADGNTYWTSFDPYPFKVGSKKLVYMGILNGSGPLKGQKCVVKSVRHGTISSQDWMLECNRSKIARDMATYYNNEVSFEERHFTFNYPVMAEIDTMSDCLCINDVLGKPKKKWADSEFVSMELYLRGIFEDFEYGWVPQADLAETEAFSHFSWCRSEGSLLVSNLQGVKTEQAYHFTGPIIHSLEMKYGSSDLGYEGIKGFFKLHKCNPICQNWPRFAVGVDLRGCGENIAVDQRCPSAPPLPSAFHFSPPPYEEKDHITFPRKASTDIKNADGQMVVQTRPVSHETRNAIQRQDSGHSSTGKQVQHIVRYQQTTQAQWQQTGCQLMYIDWCEEFINQNTTGDTSFGHSNPLLQNEMFGIQLMQVVKQMKYAVYALPPPYCTCTPRGDEITRQCYANGSDVSEKKHFSEDVVGTNYLLPPPYSEANVDPDLECVTYL